MPAQICSRIKSVSIFSNEKTIYAKKGTFHPLFAASVTVHFPSSFLLPFSLSLVLRSFLHIRYAVRQGECNWRQMQFPILDSPFVFYSDPAPFLLVFLLYWIPFTEFGRWIIGRCFLHDFARTINDRTNTKPHIIIARFDNRQSREGKTYGALKLKKI